MYKCQVSYSVETVCFSVWQHCARLSVPQHDLFLLYIVVSFPLLPYYTLIFSSMPVFPTTLFITPVYHPAKFCSLHFILPLATWFALLCRCAHLTPSLSSPSLPEMTLSHLHTELLSSPLPPFQPSLYWLLLVLPIHPFHLSGLLEWMIQIDALCTLSQSSHTQSTAPALSSLPLIPFTVSVLYTHTQNASTFNPGPGWIGEVQVDTMGATNHHLFLDTDSVLYYAMRGGLRS